MPSGPAAAGDDRRLSYVPALDGLRGVAVAAVLLYHGGFSWARGGFLGVSTFFTLSGFLITHLLLAERGRTGRVHLGAFYRRRARRLLPAALLTMLLVVVYGAVVAGPTERQGLTGDLLAMLAQVANWRFVLAGERYGDLFAARSLVQHAWSLAIEEQFYLLFPPALALLLRRRPSLPRVGAALAGALAASVGAGVVLTIVGSSPDRLYFGTDVRAAELLAGALLAVGLAHAPDALSRAGGWVAGIGSGAAVATVVAWVAVEQSWGGLHVGGLLAYAVASTALVAACLVPGPPARLLAAAPLRLLGQVSYGAYLFHWPIFRWLSAERLGTSRPIAFALGTVVTLALATASYVLLEAPVREGRWSRRPATRARPGLLPLVGAGAAVLVVVGALALPAPGPEAIDVDASLAEIDRLAEEVDPQPGAPTVGVFGDSTATALAVGLAEWASRTGRIDLGPGRTELGCGLLIDGEVRYGRGEGGPLERCEEKTPAYSDAAQVLDLAVVMFGPWDVADQRLPGDDRWRSIGDPAVDAALEAEALRLVDLLSADGATVLWVQPPRVRLGTVDGTPPAEDYPTSDPERMERFHDLGRRIRAARPDVVRLVDLAGFLAEQPGGELSPELRPDGVHLTQRGALYVSEAFLADQIDEAWAAVRGRPGS